MARLVTPAEYGAYALVIAIPGLVGAMGDFGVPTSLVQMRDASESAVLHTAIGLGASLYFIYGLLTIGGGVYLWHTHHDVRYFNVALLVATTGFLAQMYSIQLANLNRHRRFGAESFQNFIFSISQAATGILLAILGLGVYALALQGLAGQLVGNAMIQRRAPLEWPRCFSWKVAKRYFALGSKVSFGVYVSGFQGNFLSVALGKSSGESAVGYWGRALGIQALFGQNLLASVERVVYPTLCAANGDAERFRYLLERAAAMFMLFSAFAAAWLWAAGGPLVRLMLGAQWEAVVPVLVVLSFAVPAGALYSIGYISSYAIGRTGWILWSSIISTGIFLPALPFALRHGLFGVAVLYVFVRYCAGLYLLLRVFSFTKVRVIEIIPRLAGFLLAGSIAAAAMHLSGRSAVVGQWPAAGRLAILSFVGLIVYGGLVWLTQRDTLQYAVSRIRG
jgi:PST family polysaccharide transporter